MGLPVEYRDDVLMTANCFCIEGMHIDVAAVLGVLYMSAVTRLLGYLALLHNTSVARGSVFLYCVHDVVGREQIGFETVFHYWSYHCPVNS